MINMKHGTGCKLGEGNIQCIQRGTIIMRRKNQHANGIMDGGKRGWSAYMRVAGTLIGGKWNGENTWANDELYVKQSNTM